MHISKDVKFFEATVPYKLYVDSDSTSPHELTTFTEFVDLNFPMDYVSFDHDSLFSPSYSANLADYSPSPFSY